MCKESPVLQPTPTRAHALLALGRAREAADDPGLAKDWDDPWNALALSVAFSVAGKGDDAARWRERAREKMKEPHVADLLGAAKAPALKGLPNMHLRVPHKALLLAALAARFPAKQDEYLGLAATLNVRRSPPYLVVRQASDRKFGRQP
jgi:hypothetical protein